MDFDQARESIKEGRAATRLMETEIGKLADLF
jgi:hypothetical protein